MSQPPVADVQAIVDAVRRTGSVHFAKSAIPGDFITWRRHLRQRARAENVTISVIRTADFVVVEMPDWEPSQDENLAVADVLDGLITGERIVFDEALQRRRRHRLRALPAREVERS